MSDKRLWESKHPYYCGEGNYFNNDCHTEWDSWSGFHSEMGDTDPDLNLVFRWDWRDGEYEQPDPNHKGVEYLYVYFVMQRKALLVSHRVAVLRDEEPAIREWLADRYRTVLSLWEPLS